MLARYLKPFVQDRLWHMPAVVLLEEGAEVDLLLERGGRVEMAIEIKRSTAPVLSRGVPLRSRGGETSEILSPALGGRHVACREGRRGHLAR